ncbi:MAG TPA: hypothetical protein VHV30_05470, partial [Polyangiaceae bacterium]|nr:hypothetical protein [Polyangiaceae bacterium]
RRPASRSLVTPAPKRGLAPPAYAGPAGSPGSGDGSLPGLPGESAPPVDTSPDPDEPPALLAVPVDDVDG